MEFFKKIMYAPDDGAGGGGNPPADPPAKTQDPPGGDPPKSEQPPKTYTQEELDGIVARSKAAEVDKFLKDHGIESKGDLKTRLGALKKWEDEHKSELDKANEGKTAAENARNEANARAEKAEAKAEALMLGADPAKIEKLLKVLPAYEGATITDRVKAALEDLPDFKAPSQQDPNIGGRLKNQQIPAEKAAAATFEEALGLRPAAAPK